MAVLQVVCALGAARECTCAAFDDDGMNIIMLAACTFLLRSKHVRPAAPLPMHLAC